MDNRESSSFEYDFAISYASEDEAYAQSLKDRLESGGASTFFAPDFQAEIWGQNLYEYLADIYVKRGRFCILIVSRYYVAKMWTRHEWRQAQQRVLQDIDNVYVLPIRLDDTELPGLAITIAYQDGSKKSIDEITRIALKKLYGDARLPSIAPSNWVLTRHADLDNKEFNVCAWQVTISDRDQNIAGEFYVCSFITMGKQRSRRIALRVDTSYIHVLQDRVLPVLLHGYDATYEIHSWQWLDDPSVLSEVQRASKKKSTLQIKLPAKNSWSGSGIKRIEERAFRSHHKRQLQQQAERESRTNQNYDFRFHSQGDIYGVGVFSKHQKAQEMAPIRVTLRLSPEAHASLLKALRRGEVTQLEGVMVFENLPEWFIKPIDQPMDITVQPSVPKTVTHVRIEFFDHDDQLLLRSELVEMRPLVDGLEVKQYQGQPTNQPIVYTATISLSPQETRFTISLAEGNLNPIDIDWYLDMFESLSRTSRVELYNYDLQKSHSLTNYTSAQAPQIPSEARDFVKNLAIVASRLNLSLTLPEQYTRDDFETASVTAEILTTGRTRRLTGIPPQILAASGDPVVAIETDSEALDAMINQIDDVGYAYGKIDVPSELVLLGNRLNLGPSQFIVYCDKHLNDENAIQFLERTFKGVPEVGRARGCFGVDLDECYVHFPNWSQEEPSAQS